MDCSYIGRRMMRMTMRAGIAALVACLAVGGAAAQDQQTWFTVPIAAQHNSVERVLELLQNVGVDPDAIDSTSHRTALDFAASFNNVAMAKVLLDHGAHVDEPDADGNSALYWAAERSSMDMMRFLIANQAKVNMQNRHGETPLMVAAGHIQPAAVRLLIASGADTTKQDYTGRDARGWAAGNPAVLQAMQSKR